MKRILLFSLLISVAFGCNRKEVVESSYENGTPKVVKYYHKIGGKLVLDREVMYYENKQKRIEGEYNNQLRNGIWKAWYENGTIWSVGEYKDGKRNGEGISYHPNGKIYIEGMYRNDTRVGPWRFYDTAGVLTKEVDFDLVPEALEGNSLK